MSGLGELWNALVMFLVSLLVGLHDVLVGVGLGDVAVLGNLSWGLAIILFTAGIKLVTFPLTMQQIRSSKAMAAVQPEMREIQKKYAKDRERLMQEQMRLYKEHGVNPATGCLPLLIQMPIWFGLYQALFHLAQNGTAEGFASRFLWLNLAQPEPFPQILAVLTGISQWVVQRMMVLPTTDPTQKSMNNMMQFMPIMFVFFAFSVPSGLVLYWVASNVFSIVQQYFTMGWGSLFPLPFTSAKPGTSREVARIAPPSSNGKHSTSVEAQVIEANRTGKLPGAGAEDSLRGPGGGKKRKIRRRS